MNKAARMITYNISIKSDMGRYRIICETDNGCVIWLVSTQGRAKAFFRAMCCGWCHASYLGSKISLMCKLVKSYFMG